MTPTPKLRFIQRDGPMMGFSKGSDGSETIMCQKIRILQQWWTVTGTDPEFQDHFGEWRDVPMEAE